MVVANHGNLELDLKDSDGLPVLWYALNATTDFTDNSYAAVLIKSGASPDIVSIWQWRNISVIYRGSPIYKRGFVSSKIV